MSDEPSQENCLFDNHRYTCERWEGDFEPDFFGLFGLDYVQTDASSLGEERLFFILLGGYNFMKNWQKFTLLTLVTGALIGAPGVTEAAYELNPEVKTATPALMTATQIGTLCYENPAYKNLSNKDAIVVMSFGTTFKDTRAKTIEATVDAIQKAHPGVKVVTAFTSHIIIKRIKEKEGISYPTPEEALDKLKQEGYTRVALVTLDIIPGVEYGYNTGVFHHYKDKFKKLTCSTSLMYWQGQEGQTDDVIDLIKALKTQFPAMGANDALLLMAHGTPQPCNAYYSVLQAKIDEMGLKNVFVYSVEGWPNLETVLPKLKKNNIKNVTLMPLMMVAGDHATNDMAGDEPDSHKSILRAAGYNVNVYLHGIGENKAVRDLYVKKANEAWDALQAK